MENIERLQNNEKFEESFNKLLKLLEILKGKGFRTLDTELIYSELKAKRSVPIVREGVNGIRASLYKGDIKVWFTNGYEDPDNNDRREIEEIWKEIISN